MQPLSPAAREAVGQIAARHGFSLDATHAMLDAIVRGGGQMAQFSHPEFSGSGQWMRGGMTMVSDMFNNDLKGWVDALCTDLANLIHERPELLRPSAAPRSPMSQFGSASEFGGLSGPGSDPSTTSALPSSWPADLGQPTSSGSQNRSRYAVFGPTHRLAVERDGELTVYDTLDHRIGGASQQQGSGATIRFTSQHGTVDLAELPIVSGARREAPGAAAPSASGAAAAPAPARSGTGETTTGTRHADIAAAIERLADLQTKGILSPEEFRAKKVELLARI